MRRVLASDFGVWLILKDLQRISDAMIASPEYWSRLANYLLLYDQIFVPTGNLQVLPVLRLMLGEGVFDHLISNKSIVLLRYDHWIGYVGNGGGLRFFQVQPGENHPPNTPNLGTNFFEPLDVAVEDILAITNPQTAVGRRHQIRNLLLDHIVEAPHEIITEGLIDETYADILGSPYLRDMFALRNAGRTLANLRGIRSDQVTIYSPHSLPDRNDSLEIQSVLRAGFENYLLSLCAYSESSEIAGDKSTLNLIKAKGQRAGYGLEGAEAFTTIQKIANVPNIGQAFAGKQLSPEQLIELRESKHCKALREWFEEGSGRESAEEIVGRYVESIGKEPWYETLAAKTIRLATTVSLGALNPVVGAVASTADTFMLSKWFPGSSPRIFLKEAKVLMDSTNESHRSILKGSDRNKPCPCGSGKKFKKCHGRSYRSRRK